MHKRPDLVTLAIALLMAGCHERMGGYIAASAISENGFARNGKASFPQKLSQKLLRVRDPGPGVLVFNCLPSKPLFSFLRPIASVHQKTNDRGLYGLLSARKDIAA